MMMHLVYTPYIIPMLVAAVISAALSAYIWQRRRTAPGATALALLMLALTEWLLVEVLCLVNNDLSVRLIWAKVEYIGIVSVPVIWLAFALQYTRRQGWLTRRRLMLLTICPIITLLLVWTNEAHGLIWTEFSLYQHGSVMVSEKAYGAWFWVYVAYSYSLLFAGAVLVIRSAISSFWLYRRQASVILIGMLVPTVGNVVYISHFGSVQGIDPTPLAFTVSGLMLALGLFRFGLLDIVPVARDTIIKEMNDGLMVLDAQNRIVEVNPAAERITGSTASELIGQPVVQILSCWTDLTEQHREMMETQSEVALGEGGEEYYYDLRISPLYGRHSSVTGRVVTLHDITERKQQEELQRKIFENVQVGIFMVQDGKFKYVNPEFECCSGYTREELLGSPSLNLVYPEDREKVRENAIRMLKGEQTQAYEYRAVGKNGQITWIMEKVTSIEYRGERATLGSYIDITARKQEEERRSRFIAMLTHELYTPLTPVLSSASLLVEQLESKGGAESRLARNILSGAHSLIDRLSELLELAKGETGFFKVNLAPLEPERLIRRLASECSAMFDVKKQQFHLELESLLPDVFADEQRTSQVLLTLLSSANKFTPEGGQVSLRAKAEENALVIEVEDNGPGIPLEEQLGIFQPYSHSDKFSGLAFGLVISRQLIELQGGKIWCHSQPGKGSTFGFSLPLASNQKA